MTIAMKHSHIEHVNAVIDRVEKPNNMVGSIGFGGRLNLGLLC